MERDGDQTTNNNGGRAGRGGSQRRPGSTIGRGRRPGGENQMVSSTCLICQEPFLCSRNYKGHKFACWNCRMSSAALEFGFTVSYYYIIFIIFAYDIIIYHAIVFRVRHIIVGPLLVCCSHHVYLLICIIITVPNHKYDHV